MSQGGSKTTASRNDVVYYICRSQDVHTFQNCSIRVGVPDSQIVPVEGLVQRDCCRSDLKEVLTICRDRPECLVEPAGCPRDICVEGSRLDAERQTITFLQQSEFEVFYCS